MVSIIDYGVGYLFSLRSSFAAIGVEAEVTSDPETIRRADRVILPGVGAFGDAADKLRETGLDRVVREEAARGKPLMGICLGMQLLFERSVEYGEHKGLGLLKGEIRPIAERTEDCTGIPAVQIHKRRRIRLFCPFLQRRELRRVAACLHGIRRGPYSLRREGQCLRLPVPPGEKRGDRTADAESFL